MLLELRAPRETQAQKVQPDCSRMFGFKNKPPASNPPPAVASNGTGTGDDGTGLFQRLRAKLNKGDSWLTYDLANLIPGGKIDDAVLDELETRLITADVGVDTTERILSALRKKVARNELANLDALLAALGESLMDSGGRGAHGRAMD